MAAASADPEMISPSLSRCPKNPMYFCCAGIVAKTKLPCTAPAKYQKCGDTCVDNWYCGRHLYTPYRTCEPGGGITEEYYRQFCQLNPLPPTPLSLARMGKKKKAALLLDETEKKAVMENEISSGMAESCPICYEDLLLCTAEKNIKTDCGHSFHKSCLETWKKSSSTCPLCRSSVALFSLSELHYDTELNDVNLEDDVHLNKPIVFQLFCVQQHVLCKQALIRSNLINDYLDFKMFRDPARISEYMDVRELDAGPFWNLYIRTLAQLKENGITLR